MQVITGRVTVYPNPVKGRLMIGVEAGLENLTVQLCDAYKSLLNSTKQAEAGLFSAY